MFVPAWPGQVCSLGYRLVHLIESDLGISLTDEQADRVVAYYALDVETGKRLVRRAALRRPKGAGKSPEGGYLAYAELVGPVLFSHWADGQPVGRRHADPWVQLAAVSEDQTDNVMVWLFDTLAARRDVLARRGVDLGRTRIYLAGRPGRIEPVTASAGSREGQRITFAVLDQSESWFPGNGGTRLANTIRRNAAKMGGWTLELQNAPAPGDESVADETARAAERAVAGVLYDSRPAPWVEDLADRPKLIEALRVAYGEATKWVDLERLADEIQDPATDPSDARRYYLNQAVAWEEDAVELVLWDALQLPGATLQPGDAITLGFDGSDSDDSTALVAMRHSDRCLFVLRAWSKPEGAKSWNVPRVEVRDAVADAFDRYRVARMYCDPPFWQTDIDEWKAMHGPVHRWTSYSDTKIAEATARFDALTRAGEIRHNGDPELRRHLAAARRQRCRNGWRPAKKDTRKIDVFLAALAAVHAHGDALAAGELSERAEATELWFELS